MAREQSVGALAALARICDTGEGAGVLREQPFGRGPVGADVLDIVAVPAGGHAGCERSIPTLPKDDVDGLAVDSLGTQLLADGPFPAWPGPVA